VRWQPIETAPKDGTRIIVSGYWDAPIEGTGHGRKIAKALSIGRRRLPTGNWLMKIIYCGDLKRLKFTFAVGDLFDAKVDAIVSSEQTNFVLGDPQK
jgi:hypothetical protein